MDVKFRVWNRDMAATLNFKHILLNLRKEGNRPDIYLHKATITSRPKSTKRASSPSLTSPRSKKQK
jgi:hypothetical protein